MRIDSIDEYRAALEEWVPIQGSNTSRANLLGDAIDTFENALNSLSGQIKEASINNKNISYRHT